MFSISQNAGKADKAAKAPKRARPPRAREATPANRAKPVDPVVHAIARLQRRFPLAFPKNPAPKVPLKIGIFEDLVPCAQDLSLSEAELREAIRTWCRGTRYWACLIEGASRMDLAGQEAGHVRPDDAKRAQQLQARKGKAVETCVRAKGALGKRGRKVDSKRPEGSRDEDRSIASVGND
nr:ProQ/FinO family protein [Cupriavidus sp. IDO]